ncbi:MAG: diguanylate cyclase [Gammaproteobacteria bacterium]|jgi:diguanylate cyclase (GGDEF)-like protein|nr:diguanylate cyclase [Gammaproteobacteria bacterium]
MHLSLKQSQIRQLLLGTLLLSGLGLAFAWSTGWNPRVLAAAGATVGLWLVHGLWQRRRLAQALKRDLRQLKRLVRDIRRDLEPGPVNLRLAEFTPLLQSLTRSVNRIARERRKLRDLGLRDHLSRLPNRRALEDRLASSLSQARRGLPGALLLIDIDRFKEVNDRYGHEAGDRLIRAFARALRQCVRETDFVARLGGDEFAILFSFTATGQAQALAQRLRLAMPKRLQIGPDIHHRLRWTGGLTELTAKTDAGSALREADAALLQAKQAGRNCTHVAEEPVPRAVARA